MSDIEIILIIGLGFVIMFDVLISAFVSSLYNHSKLFDYLDQLKVEVNSLENKKESLDKQIKFMIDKIGCLTVINEVIKNERSK